MGFEEPAGFPLTSVVSHVSAGERGGKMAAPSARLLVLTCCRVCSPFQASHSRNLSLHALAPTLGGRSQGSSSALIASGCRKNPCVFLGVIFFLV